MARTRAEDSVTDFGLPYLVLCVIFLAGAPSELCTRCGWLICTV